MKWNGPCEIMEKGRGQNYHIKNDGKEKTFHINLLHPYIKQDTFVNDLTALQAQSTNRWYSSFSFSHKREKRHGRVNVVPNCRLTELETVLQRREHDEEKT